MDDEQKPKLPLCCVSQIINSQQKCIQALKNCLREEKERNAMLVSKLAPKESIEKDHPSLRIVK